VIVVSKQIEFDAGHRVPDHGSKCRHPHGHRYRVVAEVAGDIVTEPGAPDSGMVIDFGLLKTWLTEWIHDPLDHGFIVADFDNDLRIALAGHGWNIRVVEFTPTAENIAVWCWNQLAPVVDAHWRGTAHLHRIEVWETPTSCASYTGP
jgi:6-pyruvoyltetrahydropterin/6-carboxytetrahydropterin synthase